MDVLPRRERRLSRARLREWPDVGEAVTEAIVFARSTRHEGKTLPRFDDIDLGIDDDERTVARLLDGKPEDVEREAKFRRIFGRMRITYTGETLTSDFNGNVETSRYEVLGKDTSSVVIHALDDKPSPLDGSFEVSKFHVIHFEGPDSYWLDSEPGQIREYFRRLP